MAVIHTQLLKVHVACQRRAKNPANVRFETSFLLISEAVTGKMENNCTKKRPIFIEMSTWVTGVIQAMLNGSQFVSGL